ncbi:MAG: hypothetical protein KGN97_07425 [Bacteroidota bacterium]|nr:hypothetical protein [Bacteroidota bacterium]
MKKIVLMAAMAAVCIGSVVLESCTKENLTKESTIQNHTSSSFAQNAKTKVYLNATLQKDGNCSTPAGNCQRLREVVIHVPRLDDLIIAANSGSSTEVGNLFNSSSFNEITQYLNEEVAMKLKSGNYFIKLYHEDSNTVNFICGTTKELNFDNFEFAIEFSK